MISGMGSDETVGPENRAGFIMKHPITARRRER
jgi:hypothetical protein